MIYISVDETFLYIKDSESDLKLLNVLKKNDFFSYRYERIDYMGGGVFYRIRRRYNGYELDEAKLVFKNANFMDLGEFFTRVAEVSKKVPTSNESEIRGKVKEFLEKEYEIAYMEDEYTHASLPVRADIFAVTTDGIVITVEIKSDKDTFVRLKKQLDEYHKFSHRVYVALDYKHVQKYINKHEKYGTGLLAFESGNLEKIISSYQKDMIDASKILWKKEWLDFCRYFKGSFTNLKIHELQKIVYNTFTAAELIAISEHLFVNRYVKKGDGFKHLISDFDYKCKVANREINKIK